MTQDEQQRTDTLLALVAEHTAEIESVRLRPPLDGSSLGSLVTECADGAAVSSDGILLSLLCPISQTHIKTPIKTHACTHLQCFDLDSYAAMCMSNATRYLKAYECPRHPIRRHSTPGFCQNCNALLQPVVRLGRSLLRLRCPICKAAVKTTDDLHIDAFMQQIIEALPPPGGEDACEAVRMRADGSWQPISAEEQASKLDELQTRRKRKRARPAAATSSPIPPLKRQALVVDLSD